MKDSRLIKTISTFSSKEFKEFMKIAKNNFHKNEKLILFINFVSKQYPQFTEDNISKEKVFKAIYKNEKYEDIRIREFMATVNKVLKDFLIHIETKSSDFQYELNLLKQYNDRKLDSLYTSQLKTIKNILKKDRFKNKEYYRRMYMLANIENEHFSNKHIRALDESIQIKIDNLDYFYFSTKLIDSCEMLNRQQILNQEYKLNLFEEIEDLISKNLNKYLNQATIICYYEIFKLLKKDNDVEQFNKTVKVIKENSKFFTNNELKALYDYPQNYCIRNLNRGKDEYVGMLFALQKYVIDKEFNLINGYISGVSYNNMIAIAIKLKKLDWGKEFLEKYKTKVEPNDIENSYNMNKANLCFANADFENTLLTLNDVVFTDVYYASSAKALMVKSYYELKEFETLSYFITSFKLYLKRNKEIPMNYKKGADLFLTYSKKIFNIAEKIDFYKQSKIQAKLKTLSEEIKLEKNIHNRVWLLKIIQELLK